EDVADTRELATAVAEATALHAGTTGEQGAEEEWRRERAREMAVMADLRGDAPPATIPLTIQDPRKYFDAATQRDTAHTQQQAGQAAAPEAMDLDGPAPATDSAPAGTHATLAASLAAFRSELAAAARGSGGSRLGEKARGGKGGTVVMAPAAAAQVRCWAEIGCMGAAWVEHAWVQHGWSMGGAWVEHGMGGAWHGWSMGGAWVEHGWNMGGACMGGAWVEHGWSMGGTWVERAWVEHGWSMGGAWHGEAVKELLSHFWATYPLTSAALLAKAERHKEGISKLYDRLQKLKDGADGANRHLLSQLLQPFFQSLDAALAHFEADNARRQQRRQRVGAAVGRAPVAVGPR
ncbi:unnamed protein product, partial [Closterium sp. Yama58-4]